MNLTAPPRTQGSGDVVPMINVAFLLLIFFLVMARMAPPDPVTVTPPTASGAAVDAPHLLFVDAEGRIAFEEARGEAALRAAALLDAPLILRADAGLEAATFAGILAQLAELGVTDLRLATVSP